MLEKWQSQTLKNKDMILKIIWRNDWDEIDFRWDHYDNNDDSIKMEIEIEEVSSHVEVFYSVTRVGRIMWLGLKSYIEKWKRCKITYKER